MEQGNAENFVYEKLKSAIFKRTLRPETHLVESRIADQLGVSRTPVRAAIKRLAHDGYVTYKRNRGASIIKPSSQEIYDTFEVRMELEKAAVRKIVRNNNKQALQQLNLLLTEETDTFNKRDIGIYYNLNYAIHSGIAAMSGNPVMEEYLNRIIYRSQIYLILYENFYQMEENPSYPEHQHIIDALSLGSQTEAENAVEEHIASTLKGLRLDEHDNDPDRNRLIL